MEQLVARRAHNPKVVGSSPAPATISLDSLLIIKAFFILVGSSYRYGGTGSAPATNRKP